MSLINKGDRVLTTSLTTKGISNAKVVLHLIVLLAKGVPGKPQNNQGYFQNEWLLSVLSTLMERHYC